MSSQSVSSVDMLKRLVAFDTTSRNSNLDLITYIQGYLDELGVASTLVPPGSIAGYPEVRGLGFDPVRARAPVHACA